jgi:predicted acyl esterase
MGRRAFLALVLVACVLAPRGAARAEPVFPCTPASSDQPAPGWSTKLPDPVKTTVTKRDVQVESSDGTLLSVRYYLPDAYRRRKKPTVLFMTPYNSALYTYPKESEDAGITQDGGCLGLFFLERGYAIAIADMRGTHNSDGCFDYGGPGDQADGYAVVQRLGSQAWSNGRVGMYGISHDAMIQYAAAVKAPPALKAIIPIAPSVSIYRYLYANGIHWQTNMGTPLAYEGAVAAPPPNNVQDQNYLTNVAATTCNGPATLNGMSLNGDFTNYYRQRDLSLYANRIKAAVFHVEGTLDQNTKMDNFSAMWRALEKAGVKRKALIGPWEHGTPAVEGDELIAHWRLLALRWYEHWLHGNDTGMMREPTVMSFDQTGEMRRSSSFPPRGSRSVKLYPSGGALTGRPKRATAEYQDVPYFPRQLLMDGDGFRLRYDSAPMKKNTRIAGEPVVEIVAAIDTTDTNFIAHLYDVSPDGTATYVSRGYLDARHRTSLVRGKDVAPGVALRYRVPMLAHDWVVEQGNRLRLLIASSDNCEYQLGLAGVDETCQSSGVVSDTSAAHVTVFEGPGRTVLTIPIA